MRKSLDFVVFPVLPSLPLVAQDHPNVDVFGGCQYTHLGSEVPHIANANGRDPSLIVKISKPHVNLMAAPGSA